MNRIRLATLALLTTLNIYAQSGNVPKETGRMDRDLDVMEKVLNEVFKGEGRSLGFASGAAQGAYVTPYGAIFFTPLKGGFSFTFRDHTVVMPVPPTPPAPHPAPLAKAYNGKKDNSNHVIITDEKEEEIRIEKFENKQVDVRVGEAEKGKSKAKAPKLASVGSSDSLNEATKNEVKVKMTEFLISYGDMLSALPPDQKIMLIYDESKEDKFNYLFFNGGETIKNRRLKLSAEVTKQDVLDYRSGKLDKKSLTSKIAFHDLNKDHSGLQEFKVFAGILETIFKDSDDNAFKLSNIRYTYMPNFGIMYFIDVHQHPFFNSTAFFRDYQEKDEELDVHMEKEAGKRKEKYGEFLASLKENMVEYGRTLRSLSNKEIIYLDMDLPQCKNCQLPERISVEIKKSDIEAYEKGEKTLEQVTGNVVVKEVFAK